MSSLVASLALLVGVGCASSAGDRGPFLIDEIGSVELEEAVSDRVGQGDYVNAADGSSYRVYELSLDGDELVALTATSGELVPRLAVYGPDSTLIGLSTAPAVNPFHDREPASPRTSLVFESHRPGVYMVVVSSGEAGQYGNFELAATTMDPPAGLRPGEGIEYFFQDGLARDRGVGRPVVSHGFDVDDDGVFLVRLRSQEFDAYLYVVDGSTGQVLGENDDWGNSTDSQLIVELEAGEYEIWASAFAVPVAGSYTIETEEIHFEGSLEFVPGDGPYEGFIGRERAPIPESHRTGVALDFSLEEETTLDVVMRSQEVDAYLVLTDQAGNYITEDDDSGGGLDARIRWDLAAGDYTLWATTHGEHEMGRFYIESAVDGDPVMGGSGMGMVGQFNESVDAIGVGESLTGHLTTELHVTEPRQTFVTYYELELEADATIQIDVTSQEFDTYLLLEMLSGQLIMENDDVSPNTTDSQIVVLLEAGTYRLGVTSFAPGEVGEFELEVQEVELSNQQVL